MFRLAAEIGRQAVRNTSAHRRRSLLTLLTIGVGIFSVASVRVFTYSMERSIIARFERLGTSTVYVHHFPWGFSGGDWRRYLRRPRISLIDYEAVREGLGKEVWVALRYDRYQEKIRYQNRTEEARVIGVTEDFIQVFPLEIKYGRYFRPEELAKPTLKVVVGSKLSRALTGSEDVTGILLWYEGRPIQVIGVLSPQGSFGGDMDWAFLVPFPLLFKLYGMERFSGERTLLVRAKEPDRLPIDLLETRVRGLLRQARRLPPRAEDTFSINRQDALLSQVREITGYVQLVGFFIAGFSLLVGGIGVANVLYIAVRERRGEIGIQRAMGAPKGFILGTFLTEGVLLTLTGGAIGLFLTGGLTVVLSGWAAQEGLILAVSLADLGWTLFVTVFLGLLAAIAPAWHAARLHPIEAIRTAT
ncbi:MAG: ABC transporter permease [Bacteroidia bacterium]|nr:ABC transporter permease [Bacteroidia bacterium]